MFRPLLTQTTDAHLVRRARAEDAAAFEALVRRYQRKAHAVALGSGAHPSSVADVVQEAFLGAFLHLGELRNPGAFGPWFLATVRNLARRSRRRPAHERPLEGEGEAEAVGSDHGLEVKEFNAYLWRKVEELPEGVREAMLLYYFEGERVRAVAQALHTTVPAVKNRLQKGRELLRERLWREIGSSLRDMLPSARTWRREARRVTLAVVASLPAGWSGSAAVAGCTAGDAYGAAAGLRLETLLQGVALMTSKKLAVTTGAFLVGLFCIGLGVGYVSVGPGADRVVASPKPASPPLARRAPPPAEPSRAVDAPASGPGERETTAAPLSAAPPAAATGSLRVHLVWEGSEAPAAGVLVRAMPRVVALPRLTRWEGVTDADGIARIEIIAPGDVQLELDRMRLPRRSLEGRWIDIEAGVEREILLRLPRQVSVYGIVLDAADHPVAGAEVWLSTGDFDGLDARRVAYTEGDGSFRLPNVGSGRYVSARSPDHAPSSQHAVNGRAGENFEVRLVLAGAGGAVSGRVLDSDGRAVEGALVLAGAPPAIPGAHVTGAAPQRLFTDAVGSFLAEGVAPGEVPLFARARGLAPAEQTVPVEAGRTSHVELRLAPPSALAGSVRDDAGNAIAGAVVRAGATSPFSDTSDPRISETRTGDDGRFLLDGLPAGEQRITVSARDRSPVRVAVTLGASEILERDFVVRRLEIRGRVLLPDGTSVRRCQVSPTGLVTVFTDEDGRFRLSGCEEQGYRIQFIEQGASLASAVLEDVPPSPDELEVVLLPEDRPTASVTGKVVAPEGHPVSGARAHLWGQPGRGSERARSGVSGDFRLGPLPAGSYTLVVDAEGYPSLNVSPIEVAAGETLDLGRIELPPPGYLKVVFAGEDGAAPGGADHTLQALDAHGEPEWIVRLGTDPIYEALLAPGRHRLVLRGPGTGEVTREVEIRAGVESVVEIPLPASGGGKR